MRQRCVGRVKLPCILKNVALLVLLVMVLGLAGAPPAGALTLKAPVRFGFSAYGTTILFPYNVVVDDVTLRSENITLENFMLEIGTYVAPSQLFSVENDNMTVNTAEENLIEFALQGTLVAWVRISTGGRGPVLEVKAGGVTLTENASLAALQAADNGYYIDNDDNIIHVKVQGPMSVQIDFLASKVDAISPYWQTPTSFTITATAPTTIDSVAFYYRYSTDNSTWGPWTSIGTDSNSSDGWSQSFTADNGDGHYEFHSRASSAGLVEPAPARPDAQRGVDTVPPIITGFAIDGGAAQTASTSVTLSTSASDAGSGVYQMRFQNGVGSWSSWEAYSTSKSWAIPSGDGPKTVYAQVRDNVLNESATVSASITKVTSAPPQEFTTVTVNLVVAEDNLEENLEQGYTLPIINDILEVDLSALGKITRVVLDTVEIGENASISVQEFEDRPTELPAPLGVPYVYAEISINFTIENATIRFYVERSWVNLESVDDDTIRLQQYTGANWQELPTDKIDENSTHLFYSAVSPGFSTFVVTGQRLLPTYALVLPTEVVTTAQTTIWVRVSNPTAVPISKRCEFRIGEVSMVLISLMVGANEDKEIPLTLNVSGIQGTYAVEFWDLDEGQTLATGTITLSPPAPAPPAPPGIPILFLAAGLTAAVCLIAAAVLRVRRPPAHRAPRRRLRRRIRRGRKRS